MKTRLIMLLLIIMQYSSIASSQIEIAATGVSLVVQDMNISTQWYEKNLGFMVDKKMNFEEFDNLKIYILKTQDYELELMSKDNSFRIQEHFPDYSVNNQPLQGYFKWVIKVKNFDELFELHQKNKVDMRYSKTFDQTFQRNFYVISDPDGNSIQIIESN